MIVGYCRSSTADQKAGLHAQVIALEEAGAEKIFREVASGTNADRLQLIASLEFVREGDTFVISKIARLARSTSDFLRIVDQLENKGVGLRVLDFGGREINTKSPADRLIITLFAGFAQFERDLMRERQRIGIEAAKNAGKYKGRKPTAQAKAPEVKRMLSDGHKPTEVALALGISRASVYRIRAVEL